VKCSSPSTCVSAPWQRKHWPDRIGSTSRVKNSRCSAENSAAGAASSQRAGELANSNTASVAQQGARSLTLIETFRAEGIVEAGSAAIDCNEKSAVNTVD